LTWVWTLLMALLWTFFGFFTFQTSSLFTIVSFVISLHLMTLIVVEVWVIVWNCLLTLLTTSQVLWKRAFSLLAPGVKLIPLCSHEEPLAVLFLFEPESPGRLWDVPVPAQAQPPALLATPPPFDCLLALDCPTALTNNFLLLIFSTLFGMIAAWFLSFLNDLWWSEARA